MFPLQFVMMVVDCRLGVARGSKYNINALRRAMKNRVRLSRNGEGYRCYKDYKMTTTI